MLEGVLEGVATTFISGTLKELLSMELEIFLISSASESESSSSSSSMTGMVLSFTWIK